MDIISLLQPKNIIFDETINSKKNYLIQWLSYLKKMGV